MSSRPRSRALTRKEIQTDPLPMLACHRTLPVKFSLVKRSKCAGPGDQYSTKHDQPRREPPPCECQERGQRKAKIQAAVDCTCPNRVVKGRQQQADHRSVDSCHRAARRGELTEPVPEGQRTDHQEESWKEDRGDGDSSAEPTCRRPCRNGTQKSREGEQWARNSLRQSIAGKKIIVRNPTGRYHCRLQQRQHHMAATEDQCTGAIKGVDQIDDVKVCAGGQHRQAEQEYEVESEANGARDVARPSRVRRRQRPGCRRQPQRTDQACRNNSRYLAHTRGPERGDGRRSDRDGGARLVGAQALAHSPKRLSNYRDGDDLESVQPIGADFVVDCREAGGEENERNG